VLRKVDWEARDVAHVILEDIESDIRNRFDYFPVAQTDRSCAREVRVGELRALNDDAARKFEDGVGPCVARACADRISDFGLIQTAFRGHRRVRAQAVVAEVALGDRESELLASFLAKGSTGERFTQTHESFKCRRCIRKNAKQIGHQRESRSYLCEESSNRTSGVIGINWLDAVLVSGVAHRFLRLMA
jgi:hypothetical protein